MEFLNARLFSGRRGAEGSKVHSRDVGSFHRVMGKSAGVLPACSNGASPFSYQGYQECAADISLELPLWRLTCETPLGVPYL